MYRCAEWLFYSLPGAVNSQSQPFLYESRWEFAASWKSLRSAKIRQKRLPPMDLGVFHSQYQRVAFQIWQRPPIFFQTRTCEDL